MDCLCVYWLVFIWSTKFLLYLRWFPIFQNKCKVHKFIFLSQHIPKENIKETLFPEGSNVSDYRKICVVLPILSVYIEKVKRWRLKRPKLLEVITRFVSKNRHNWILRFGRKKQFLKTLKSFNFFLKNWKLKNYNLEYLST